MQTARLNIFQRLTRRWDEIHPYNAAQVMQLRGSAQIESLQAAWQEMLRELGLARVESARCRSLTRAESLEEFLTDQMNCPFDEQAPLRPFVIANADSYFAGVVYHHWVADSASIRLLLREWFYRLHDPSRARRTPLQFASTGYWDQFGPRRGRWELFDSALTALRWSMRLRQARRVEMPNCNDFRTHFSLHDLPDGLVHRLLPVARRAQATLNDLFLAALAQVADTLVPVMRTSRRNDLALGTIVDLRSRARDDIRDQFGLFLGFTNVICRSDDASDWPRLLKCIAAQSALHKRDAAPEASMLRMAVALAAHRIYSKPKLLNWYRKRIPLAAGISNVNLNRDWPAEFHPEPLRNYIRVSPCGPMMPLVFTTTTLGDKLNFGLTCRASIIDTELSARIVQKFTNRLIHLAETGM